MIHRTVTLEQYRALAADARAALRMIREVVEQHAPPGSVPSEEMVEPPFAREAEVLVSGILSIVTRAIGGDQPSIAVRKAYSQVTRDRLGCSLIQQCLFEPRLANMQWWRARSRRPSTHQLRLRHGTLRLVHGHTKGWTLNLCGALFLHLVSPSIGVEAELKVAKSVPNCDKPSVGGPVCGKSCRKTVAHL
jgi:hypothetical protein